MFDHIHFQNNYENLDISTSDILRQTDQIPEDYSAVSFQNSDFHIHGLIRSLLPLPMSNANREQYMYIQNFVYMVTDDTYYSKQRYFDSFQILFTYNGCGEIFYDGKKYELTRGTAFFIDCRKAQTYHTVGDRWETSDLHFFGGKSVFFYREFFQNRSPLFVVDNIERFQNLLEELLLCHTHASAYREWNVSSSLENLLRYLLQSSKSDTLTVPDRIQYLITYIENNFQKPLTLDGLSDFSGISKYHLAREFKKYTGFAPFKYITELRIERAKSILLQTNIPAYKVGILVGILDEANFIRLFKQRCGMTPGDYRNTKK